jgi:hypothetical protein
MTTFLFLAEVRLRQGCPSNFEPVSGSTDIGKLAKKQRTLRLRSYSHLVHPVRRHAQDDGKCNSTVIKLTQRAPRQLGILKYETSCK